MSEYVPQVGDRVKWAGVKADSYRAEVVAVFGRWIWVNDRDTPGPFTTLASGWEKVDP